MLEQRVTNRRPGTLRGLGIIALAAAAVLAGSAFFYRLQPRIGRLSSVLFIAYGCAIAWLLLDRYVLGFVYTATNDVLRVCRTYGKRERFMTDVWLNQVTSYGSPEEVRARCPGARLYRATRPQCDLEPLALAYREDGKSAVVVIQPDARLREHILGRIKK